MDYGYKDSKYIPASSKKILVSMDRSWLQLSEYARF